MYKETAEHVFDLLESEYRKRCALIHLIGENNLQVYIPLKFKENLKAIYKMYFPTTGEYKVETYPIKYRKMDIVYTNVNNIMFALK